MISINGFDEYYRNIISPDIDYCDSKEILYMPSMWPGFSWHALKKRVCPLNDIPRLGGKFLWQQAYRYVSNPKVNSIWMAQFDEVDEGTAIFKVAATQRDVPAEGDWLTLDADAQRMMGKEINLTETIPGTLLA